MSINRPYGSVSELPGEIPIFPLSGCLLLPRCDLPLNIFEPRYLQMVDAALRGDRLIGMIQPRDATAAVPELFTVGCAGRLTKVAETGDGRYIVTLTGVCRFRTERETTDGTPYRTFAVSFGSFADDLTGSPDNAGVDRDEVLRALRAYAERHALGVDWTAIADVPSEMLVNALAMMSPFGSQEKQVFLEASTLTARAQALVATTQIELAGASPVPSRLN